MPQHVTVTAYDPRWPQLYEREAAAISAALGGALSAIHHIGSTAVPGLAAKPIIDIMPVALGRRRRARRAGGARL